MGLLHDAGLADLYHQDIFSLNPLLNAMSARGMPVDQAKRLAVAQQLKIEQDRVMEELRALIPPECCPTKIYKRKPKSTERLRCESCTQAIRVCPLCGKRVTTKKHPCWAKNGIEPVLQTVEGERWVKVLPFVPSPKGLLVYLKHKGYPIPKRDGRPTTDEAALRRLALKYEADKVFPTVLAFRGVDKVRSTYVGRPDDQGVKGGLHTRADGHVHTTFKHDPSTLRLSSAAPNMQNIPR